MNGTLCIQFTRFDFTRAFFCAPFSASHLQKTWSIHMKSTRRHIDRQTARRNWIFFYLDVGFLLSAIVVLHGFVALFSLLFYFSECAQFCVLGRRCIQTKIESRSLSSFSFFIFIALFVGFSAFFPLDSHLNCIFAFLFESNVKRLQ